MEGRSFLLPGSLVVSRDSSVGAEVPGMVTTGVHRVFLGCLAGQGWRVWQQRS